MNYLLEVEVEVGGRSGGLVEVKKGDRNATALSRVSRVIYGVGWGGGGGGGGKPQHLLLCGYQLFSTTSASGLDYVVRDYVVIP